MKVFVGTIGGGIDLAAFAKDTGAGGKSGELLVQVEEVTPVVSVTDMKSVY